MATGIVGLGRFSPPFEQFLTERRRKDSAVPAYGCLAEIGLGPLRLALAMENLGPFVAFHPDPAQDQRLQRYYALLGDEATANILQTNREWWGAILYHHPEFTSELRTAFDQIPGISLVEAQGFGVIFWQDFDIPRRLIYGCNDRRRPAFEEMWNRMQGWTIAALEQLAHQRGLPEVLVLMPTESAWPVLSERGWQRKGELIWHKPLDQGVEPFTLSPAEQNLLEQFWAMDQARRSPRLPVQ